MLFLILSRVSWSHLCTLLYHQTIFSLGLPSSDLSLTWPTCNARHGSQDRVHGFCSLETTPGNQHRHWRMHNGKPVMLTALFTFDSVCSKHVWVSTSSDLHLDAKRDLMDLGCHCNVINGCQTLDREHRAFGLGKDFQEGVLFLWVQTNHGFMLLLLSLLF